jgi:hypothetical protein
MLDRSLAAGLAALLGLTSCSPAAPNDSGPGGDTSSGGTSSGGKAAAGASNGGASAGSNSAGSNSAGSNSAGSPSGGTSAAGAGAAGASAGDTATIGAGTGGGSAVTTLAKPRVIHTTDLGGDPDDQQSLVRVMVTANEFEIEGLVVVTSCWKKSQSNTAMLDTIVNAYGQALPNLEQHASGYPSLEYLQSISKLGQTGYDMADVGAGKDSPGSELIVAAADKPDPRPLWINLWGGGNTLAQALWKVRNTRTAEQVAQFVSKLRVYDVLGQDESGAWMAKTFPGLFYIRATGVYGWQPSDAWLSTNIQSKGPLGAVYPKRQYDTEGDSPAFMHEYPNGLHDPEQLEQGGWGGRFETTKKSGIRGMSPVTGEAQYDPYQMYANTAEGADAISRWRPGIDHDFQARMDWSIKSQYADANHHPLAVLNDDKTRQVLRVSVAAGSNFALDASGSTDPDGNALVYAWSFYPEPSSYAGPVAIQNSSAASASVAVPADASGKNIHLILELHDSGTPNLYAYRRLIINVP